MSITVSDRLVNERIAVLSGGLSRERDISLKSGKAVYNSLKCAGLDVFFMDLDVPEVLAKAGRTDFQIAFIALHGRYGEDGAVQSLLEDKGIRYTGSGPEASRIAIDKCASKRIFREKGLKVPSGVELEYSLGARIPETEFPCIVKPSSEGSSIGLHVVHDRAELKRALLDASEKDTRVLLEEFIRGRELTVGILNDSPLPVIEIKTPKGLYDYGAKYTSVKTEYVVPAVIEKSVEKKAGDMALEAHRALGCRSFSRVDFRMTEKGELFVLEVNTIPGLTKRSLLPKAAEAAGVDFLQLCVNMLEDAF